MKPNTTLLVMMFFTILLIIHIAFSNMPKHPSAKHLQEEISTLQLIKDAVLEKYVPDSLKDASRDASHDLMYAEDDGEAYWDARHTINQTEEYIKDCKPCMYIDSVLQTKTKELEELSK